MPYHKIIKTMDKRILYFFQNDGICMKNLLRPNENYKIIYENAMFDFDVIETDNGSLAIICQDEKGSIIILQENDNSFLKTTLLNNRSQVPYEKSFKIHRHNKWLSLSYILNYQGNHILTHQILNEENLEPIVIDYVDSEEHFCYVNKSYDLYCFYSKEGEFGYRVFKWGKKQWENFISLGKGHILSGISNKNGNCYLAYEEGEHYFIQLVKFDNFNVDSKTLALDFIHPGDEINLLMEKEMLWITVNRNGFIFGRKTDGEMGELSNMYSFINEGRLHSYHVSINEKDFQLDRCFGYEINYKPQLVLYKDLLISSKTIFPTQLIEPAEELKELSGGKKEEESQQTIEINKLKIRMKDLENKIKKLNQKVSNLEKESKPEPEIKTDENKN